MGNVKKRELAIEEPIVAEYRKLFPQCQNCVRRKATDIREIFSAGRRHVARTHRSCILHLCRACHEIIQDWQKPAQLALKFNVDKQGFDILEYNRLAPKPVTMAEIEALMLPF